MNQNEINEKLKDINTEDLIWIILIGIIILSFISNGYEKKYYLNNDNSAKIKYQNINIIICAILLIIYIYFLKSSIDSLKKLNSSDSDKKKRLVTLSFIASLLITISGALFLYISIVDNNIDVELAFD